MRLYRLGWTLLASYSHQSMTLWETKHQPPRVLVECTCAAFGWVWAKAARQGLLLVLRSSHFTIFLTTTTTTTTIIWLQVLIIASSLQLSRSKRCVSVARAKEIVQAVRVFGERKGDKKPLCIGGPAGIRWINRSWYLIFVYHKSCKCNGIGTLKKAVAFSFPAALFTFYAQPFNSTIL